MNDTALYNLYKQRTAETSGRSLLGLDYLDKYFNPKQLLSGHTQKADINLAIDLYKKQLSLDLMEGRQYAVSHDLKKIQDYNSIIDPGSSTNNAPDRDFSYVHSINQYISTANRVRFNYLWTSSIIRSGGLNPAWDNFFNQAGLYPGTASFVFYFWRGGTKLINRLKHVVGFWDMTEQEKAVFNQTTVFERLYAQINMDKYDLLNDLIWAPANLACFVWYNSFSVYHFLNWTIEVGSKAKNAANIGNILTVALFCMDFFSAVMQLIEAEHEFTAQKNNLTVHSSRLKQKELAYYTFEHKYKIANLYTDLVYSICLTIGFAIMTGVMISPFGASAGIVGALMCWMGGIIKDAIKNAIFLEKLHEEQWFLQQAHDSIIKNGLNDQANQAIIWSDSCTLSAQHAQKQAEIEVQHNKFYFNLVVDSLLPVVLWSAMIFCPWSLSVVIVAAALLVTYASYQYIIRYAEKCTEGYKLNGNKITYSNQSATIDTPVTKSSVLNTARELFYVLVTLAPIFSNVDKLMDEISKFSDSRNLTSSQLEEIIQTGVKFNTEVQEHTQQPTAILNNQSTDRGLFWSKWTNESNPVYCFTPGK